MKWMQGPSLKCLQTQILFIPANLHNKEDASTPPQTFIGPLSMTQHALLITAPPAKRMGTCKEKPVTGHPVALAVGRSLPAWSAAAAQAPAPAASAGCTPPMWGCTAAAAAAKPAVEHLNAVLKEARTLVRAAAAAAPVLPKPHDCRLQHPESPLSGQALG